MFFDPAYPSLKNGLVGYWSPVATGPTGLQLLDLSGQNNHGTLTNMDAPTDWVQSPYGTVLDFDGVNDYVSLTSKNLASFATTEACVFFWVFPRTTSRNTFIADWSASGTDETLRIEMSGFGLTSGRIGGSVLTYGDLPIQTSSAPALNQWHCIAIQRKIGLQELFWNGVLDASRAGVLSNTALTNPIVLGKAGSYNSLYANCQIANLAIWNRSLTPSEVQTLYHLGPGKLLRSKPTGGPSKRKWWPGVKTPKSRPIIPTQRGIKSGPVFYDPKAAWFKNGLVGHWCPSLTGATGTQLLDLSGQNNNGALINYGNSLNANTIWLDSQYGTVLTANNISERVDFQNIPQINSGEVTFGFWYYPLSITGLSTVFNNWSFSQTAGGFYCFRNGATIAFQEDGPSWRVTTGNILTANTWHHIVCRRSNGIGGMRIFCNGVIDPASSTAGGTQSTTQPFNLFGNYGGTGPGNCRIADFAIWNRSLTDSEIQQLYQRRLGGFASRKPYRRSSYSPAPKKIFKSRIDRKRSVSLVHPDHDNEWVTNGLVGFWCPSLTGATGTQLLDLSGQNNNGVLTNMDVPTDWVDSPYGTVLDFDGTNDYVDLVRQGVLYRSGSISISAWILRSGQSGTVIADYNSAGNRASFVLYIRTGKLEFFFESSSAVQIAQSSVDVPLNQWSHICGTYNGNDRNVFINGVLTGSNSTSQTDPTQAEVGTPAIGRAGSFNGLYLNARIADLSVYNRALNPSEIQTLYQLGPRMGFSRRPSRSPTWMVEADETIGNRRRRIICGGKN